MFFSFCYTVIEIHDHDYVCIYIYTHIHIVYYTNLVINHARENKCNVSGTIKTNLRKQY